MQLDTKLNFPTFTRVK